MQIHEVDPGDFVLTMEGLMEIESVHGVNPNGSVRPPSEGGVSVTIVGGFEVSMYEALAFFRRSRALPHLTKTPK